VITVGLSTSIASYCIGFATGYGGAFYLEQRRRQAAILHSPALEEVSSPAMEATRQEEEEDDRNTKLTLTEGVLRVSSTPSVPNSPLPSTRLIEARHDEEAKKLKIETEEKRFRGI